MLVRKIIDFVRWVWIQTKQNYELIWCETWHDTMRGMEWIQELPSVSPGRWAVGYNYMYVMTRILDAMKPHHVLDLGLGVSTQLFSTYFSYFGYDDGLHLIAEHDENWIKFYEIEKGLSPASTIKRQKLVKKKMGGQNIMPTRILARTSAA